MPPDALVNNAALFTGDETAIKAINLEAPKKLTVMMAGREAGVGAVVNVLDAGVLGSGRRQSMAADGYRKSKQALAEFTKTSAATFAATLRVNGVAPGPVMAPTDVHEQAGEMLLDRRPTADDVAAAVSYLLSAEATTGTVVPVDAGQNLLRA